MLKNKYDEETMKKTFTLAMLIATGSIINAQTYKIVGSGQSKCYNNTTEIVAPKKCAAFFGQDAQNPSNKPSYTDNGNGTI